MKVSILIKVSKVAQSKIEDHKERQPHNFKTKYINYSSRLTMRQGVIMNIIVLCRIEFCTLPAFLI